MAVLCLCIALAVLVMPAAAAGTTSVIVTKYCGNNYSAVDQSATLDASTMKTGTTVESNGDIYMQGPVFLDEWIAAGFNESDYNIWDQTETGVNLVSYGGHNGTSVSTIVSAVGGMSTGDEIAIRSVGTKTYTMWFNATHVNNPPSELGELVLTWWDSVYGDVPSWSDGMRLYFYDATDNNFTNWDMHESLPSWYWKYWYDKNDNYKAYPSAKGLSVKQVTNIDIYPPHRYDFATGGDTVEYAYEGGVGASPGLNDPSGTTVDTSKIAADDSVSEQTNSGVTGEYAAQRFVFNVTEDAANIEKLAFTWIGTSSHDDTSKDQGATVSILTDGGYVGLTGDITSNIGDYVVNGNVTVLVKQNAAQFYDENDEVDKLSHIITNYVKLVVTHHHTN